MKLQRRLDEIARRVQAGRAVVPVVSPRLVLEGESAAAVLAWHEGAGGVIPDDERGSLAACVLVDVVN